MPLPKAEPSSSATADSPFPNQPKPASQPSNIGPALDRVLGPINAPASEAKPKKEETTQASTAPMLTPKPPSATQPNGT